MIFPRERGYSLRTMLRIFTCTTLGAPQSRSLVFYVNSRDLSMSDRTVYNGWEAARAGAYSGSHRRQGG